MMFDVVAKVGNATERSLKIDIFGLRESEKNGELGRIAWMPGAKNPAYALTKVT